MGTIHRKSRNKARRGGRGKKPVTVHRVDDQTYLADSQSQPGTQYGLKHTGSG